jgi:hypothetical protein
MKEKKDESFESLAEQRIREAQDKGEFDDLAGKGNPIPGLADPHDEMWWVKKWIEREGLSILPEGLELRRDVEKRLERIWKLLSIEAVRNEVEGINARIKRFNRSPVAGPHPNLKPIDADRILNEWARIQRNK